MPEILFIIGLILVVRGKVRLLQSQSEGPTVRAAGFLLMMPVLVTSFLSLALGYISHGEPAAIANTLPLIFYLQFPVMLVCGGAAYVLISRNSIPVEAQPPEQPPMLPTAPPRPYVPGPLPPYPRVMTVGQAASYLETTEQHILDLIENGKIAASRMNYRYQIARRVLDDFMQEYDQNSR